MFDFFLSAFIGGKGCIRFLLLLLELEEEVIFRLLSLLLPWRRSAETTSAGLPFRSDWWTELALEDDASDFSSSSVGFDFSLLGDTELELEDDEVLDLSSLSDSAPIS